MREIITDYDALSVRSDEIDTRKENAEMRKIIVDLKNTIRENKLLSLSAVQIGYPKRIFCINFNGDIRTFINPVLANTKGLELSRETCPSLPGKTYLRFRHNDIMFIFQTPLGKTETCKLAGMSARIFQHELDHLDGLLLSDVGLEIDDDFMKASKEEQEEIIKMYLDSLDVKQKSLSKEIEENKELKQTSEAIKFMESVARGDTKLSDSVEFQIKEKSKRGRPKNAK